MNTLQEQNNFLIDQYTSLSILRNQCGGVPAEHIQLNMDALIVLQEEEYSSDRQIRINNYKQILTERLIGVPRHG